MSNFPIDPTKWADNKYQTEWAATDYLETPDGVGFYPKHHCKHTYNISKPFIKKFRNAIDVGCRVGEYTRYLHLDFQHVYAFDPNLWAGFSNNVDLKKVTHFNCALGDENTQITMFGGMHTAREGIKAKVKPCLKLDDFMLTDIDYVKIDVEGFEHKVLLGAQKTIEKWNPVIVIEQNHVTIAGASQFAAKEYLESIGYRQAAVDSRGWDIVMVRA